MEMFLLLSHGVQSAPWPNLWYCARVRVTGKGPHTDARKAELRDIECIISLLKVSVGWKPHMSKSYFPGLLLKKSCRSTSSKGGASRQGKGTKAYRHSGGMGDNGPNKQTPATGAGRNSNFSTGRNTSCQNRSLK